MNSQSECLKPSCRKFKLTMLFIPLIARVQLKIYKWLASIIIPPVHTQKCWSVKVSTKEKWIFLVSPNKKYEDPDN